METKLDVLNRHVANGRYADALKLAAKWQNLGGHKKAITQAWQAIKSPQFYRDTDQDPELLDELGKQAIHERYGIPLPDPLMLSEEDYRRGYYLKQKNHNGYDLIKIVEVDGARAYVVKNPYWVEFRRVHRYRVEQVNDGTLEGAYKGCHKEGKKSFFGYGKTHEEALADLEKNIKAGNKRGK